MIFPTFVPPTTQPPSFVLDVSVVAAWATLRVAPIYCDQIQLKLLSAAVVVPAAWSLDVGEVLRAALGRGATTPHEL